MTPLPHAAAGLIGWKLAARGKGGKTLAVFVFVACLPDIDFVLYPLLGRPDWLVHQRYTHNIVLSVLSALAFFPLLKEARLRVGLVLTALSHLVLDVIVVDNLAPIGFRPFLPFSDAYLNWGLFPFVRRGTIAEVLSVQNLVAFGLEIVLFVLPALWLCRKELAALEKGAGPGIGAPPR
ncbi:MAG: metal-dependent hydrolase [Candidatus Aminicenantes bacterium]|nr:metal-dependent hydrolase [Candidatus Aminicenantes bacterium]